MFNGSREPIESPNNNGIKMFLFRIAHQPIELRPAFLRAAPSAIGVLVDDLGFPLLRPESQGLELRLDVLAVLLRRDASVEREAHYSAWPASPDPAAAAGAGVVTSNRTSKDP